MTHQILKDSKIKVLNPQKFKLDDVKTDYFSIYKNEKIIKESLKEYKEKISQFQDSLFAQGKHSVLIILQAIDAAGKDSCIKHVMKGVNPQGVSVQSFKQPTSEELAHDFLWRTYRVLPEKGKIGIFNRSYYEEVLVVKVNPHYLLNQNLPNINSVEDVNEEFWQNRYDAINAMEKHLSENGTHIIKIFLNISKKEQKKRFLERIDNPEKNWKFSYNDLKERKKWDLYQEAYEKMIKKTSTNYAPWFVIPSDDQWVSRAMFGDILLETLEQINPNYPSPNDEEMALLKQAKKELKGE